MAGIRSGIPGSAMHRAAIGLALFLACGPLAAIQQISLELGEISGLGWSLGQTTLSFDLSLEAKQGDVSDEVLSGRILLNKPQLPGLPFRLTQMELRCKKLRVTGQQIACRGGRLRLQPAITRHRWMPVSFTYQRQQQALRLSMPSLRWSKSRIGIELQANAKRWQAKIRVHQLALKDLRQQNARHRWFSWPELNPNATIAGSMVISRRGKRPIVMRSDLQIRNLGFSDSAGELACEAVTAKWKLQASISLGPDSRGADLRDRKKSAPSSAASSASGTLAMQITAGQCYVDPLFIEAGRQAMTLKTDWRYQNGAIKLTNSVIHDPGLAQIQGDIHWQKGVLDADIQWTLEHPEKTYQRYAQAFLQNTAAEDLELAGQLSGHLGIRTNQLNTLGLELKQFYIEDRRGRFALYDIEGKVDWDREGPGGVTLSWQGGQALAFELGASALNFASKGSEYTLQDAIYLPVLDGQLVLETAIIKPREGELPDWTVDGYLTPVSLGKLAAALQWPILDGKLSGVIPAVSYRAGNIQVDGLLLARVFDGQILIRNLTIERPFGHLPRLQADIELKNLNLKSLTSTYEFGRIEGSLEGRIENLVMENWQPSAFDAQLISPQDDPRPHRISQRAIDNLTTIGSGVSGLFANPFLALFDNFRYDRLGIACRLRQGRCQMSGVEDRDSNGYYIVKGGGLPRIDVVGYQREVDWDTLLERLRSVNLDIGPQIQ